eukprot:3824113-Rhodomonas_salina.1
MPCCTRLASEVTSRSPVPRRAISLSGEHAGCAAKACARDQMQNSKTRFQIAETCLISAGRHHAGCAWRKKTLLDLGSEIFPGTYPCVPPTVMFLNKPPPVDCFVPHGWGAYLKFGTSRQLENWALYPGVPEYGLIIRENLVQTCLGTPAKTHPGIAASSANAD